MNTILARLKEPSTYRGLALLAGVVGVNVSPEFSGAIATAVASFVALIEIFRKEQQAK